VILGLQENVNAAVWGRKFHHALKFFCTLVIFRIMLGQVKKVSISGERSDIEQGHDQPLLESEIRERTDQLLLASAEIDYQEEMIRQRQEGINTIQRDVTTINRLFQDVAVHVSAQGEMLDHIEANVTNARDETERATQELSSASRRAPSGRRTCVHLIVVVVLILVLLAMIRALFLPHT
jgi:hypothetical protein